MATALGMTPPIPTPAKSRSQNICVRSVEKAAIRVNTPKTMFAQTSAALRP